MIKDKLNKYKQIYWDIKLPEARVQQQWQSLKPILNIQLKLSFPYFRQGTIFLSLLIVFLIGVAGFTKAATPGSPLYKARVLSDEITGKISGKPELTMERRIKDVIEASKKQPAKIEQATIEYSKALEQTEQKIKKNEGISTRVSNSLDQQEQWLKKAIQENPASEEKLDVVLKRTREAKEKLQEQKKEEVKGVKMRENDNK